MEHDAFADDRAFKDAFSIDAMKVVEAIFAVLFKLIGHPIKNEAGVFDAVGVSADDSPIIAAADLIRGEVVISHDDIDEFAIAIGHEHALDGRPEIQ